MNFFKKTWLVWIIVLTGCATAGLQSLDTNELFGKSLIVERRADFNAEEASWFREEVKPVLDQR